MLLSAVDLLPRESFDPAQREQAEIRDDVLAFDAKTQRAVRQDR